MTSVPLGYDDDEIDLGFTQGEIDMLYFAALHHIGHPQALELELDDPGFETLLKALKKIQDHMETLYTNGEPDVVVPE